MTYDHHTIRRQHVGALSDGIWSAIGRLLHTGGTRRGHHNTAAAAARKARR